MLSSLNELKRLFFALWPDDALGKQCAGLAKALSNSGGKPVNSGNIHVTVVFLGAVDAALESSMLQSCEEIKLDPFTIRFNELSFWRKPGIICLTGSNPESNAMNLADRLSAMVSSFGHPIDERPYIPHVTLIRKARQAAPVEFEPILWQAKSFCLVESCSAPGGAVYRVVKQWPLLEL